MICKMRWKCKMQDAAVCKDARLIYMMNARDRIAPSANGSAQPRFNIAMLETHQGYWDHEALSPALQRTDAKKTRRVAPASHMIPEGGMVETMLKKPQTHD